MIIPTSNPAPLPAHQPDGAPAVADPELVDSRGVLYRDFKRTLTPYYTVVWAHLLGGHLALLLLAAAVVVCELYLPWSWAVAAAVVGSVMLGYTLAYINLFFHEAAHYLLAPRRALNDRLANLLIGVLFGQDIRAYRLIHFDHHRHLGTPQDTERTYFDALNLRFFLASLCGIKAWQVLRERQRFLKECLARKGQSGPPLRWTGPLVLGVLLHGGLLLAAVAFGLWLAAAAWLLAVGVFYPAFGAIRQVLEHRDERAADVDFRQVPHGALSRLFGDGPLASTLGGAGFNRHLLHHWEPQISCTRLKDLERFLLDTPLAAQLEASRASYWQTFRRLLKW
jgi:fatty acid desaturase